MEDSFGFITISHDKDIGVMGYGVTTHKIWIFPSEWWENTAKAFKRSIKVLNHEVLHHVINITEGEEACKEMDNIGFFHAKDPEFPRYGSDEGFRKKSKKR